MLILFDNDLLLIRKFITSRDKFSEDIDLAILGGHELNGNQLKSRIRDVEHIVVTGLEYFKHEAETKGSRYAVQFLCGLLPVYFE